jgi:hypothetical protein
MDDKIECGVKMTEDEKEFDEWRLKQWPPNIYPNWFTGTELNLMFMAFLAGRRTLREKEGKNE